jgi:predicted nucleic acid-binding protein
MDAKVVDASAIAALLFAESQADQVEAMLVDAQLFAPELIEFELANVCWVKCRRHPDQRSALLAGYQQRRRLPIETVAVEYFEVLTTALETGLSVYDASYLWLSRHLSAELVTLDRALERAAARAPRN